MINTNDSTRVPDEAPSSTALARHDARRAAVATRDLPEVQHFYAAGGGACVFVDAVTPRLLLVLEHAGFEVSLGGAYGYNHMAGDYISVSVEAAD
jgi:hypothetical protein